MKNTDNENKSQKGFKLVTTRLRNVHHLEKIL